MNFSKILIPAASLAAVSLLTIACSTTQIGVKENWIDERDVIALVGKPVDAWVAGVGTPTLVEISGDTSIYYYNYRPTMYAVAKYDSTTFFSTWGSAIETKPEAGNATKIWGSRKDVMRIRVVNNAVISATIIEGPDKKNFIRDLNGNLVPDPTSGYVPDVSAEQKLDAQSEEFIKATNNANPDSLVKSEEKLADSVVQAPVSNVSSDSLAQPENDASLGPWEQKRYRDSLSEERKEARLNEENAENTTANPPASETVAELEPAPQAPETPE